MMKSKELIKSKLLSDVKLEKAFYDINNELLANNDEGLFITCLVMVINLESLECNIINAGHEKPLLIRNNKTTRMDIESNFILGGDENFKYISEKIKLQKGDRLILHTDGLNESINDQREEFGYDRIIEVLNNTKPEQDYIEQLNNALKEFTTGNEQFDDVTIVSISLKDSDVTIDKKDNELIIKSDKPSLKLIDVITTNFFDTFVNLNQEIKSKVAIIIDDIINNYVSYEDINTLTIEVRFAKVLFELIL